MGGYSTTAARAVVPRALNQGALAGAPGGTFDQIRGRIGSEQYTGIDPYRRRGPTQAPQLPRTGRTRGRWRPGNFRSLGGARTVLAGAGRPTGLGPNTA